MISVSDASNFVDDKFIGLTGKYFKLPLINFNLNLLVMMAVRLVIFSCR